MKNVIFTIISLLLFSCKKNVDPNIFGYYNLKGIEVNCSYYYCDTVNVSRRIHVKESRNDDFNNVAYITYYNTIYDTYRSVWSIDTAIILKSKTIFKSRNLRIEIDNKTQKMKYFIVRNFSFNYTKPLIEARNDSSSFYRILEGYKE